MTGFWAPMIEVLGQHARSGRGVTWMIGADQVPALRSILMEGVLEESYRAERRRQVDAELDELLERAWRRDAAAAAIAEARFQEAYTWFRVAMAVGLALMLSAPLAQLAAELMP